MKTVDTCKLFVLQRCLYLPWDNLYLVVGKDKLQQEED